MRITFSLAVLAATVFATPLAHAADLAQSAAGALMQIDAHSLDSAGDPISSGDPDYLLLGQYPVATSPWETAEKQAALYDALKDLANAVEPSSFRSEPQQMFDEQVKAIKKELALCKKGDGKWKYKQDALDKNDKVGVDKTFAKSDTKQVMKEISALLITTATRDLSSPKKRYVTFQKDQDREG